MNPRCRSRLHFYSDLFQLQYNFFFVIQRCCFTWLGYIGHEVIVFVQVIDAISLRLHVLILPGGTGEFMS